MSVIMIAPGKVMATGSGHVALWKPLLAAGGGGVPPASVGPAIIPDLLGWWDASHFSGGLDGAGQPIGAWHQATAYVRDRSTAAQPLSIYTSRPSSVQSAMTPRLAGTKGGIGASTQGTGILTPALTPYHGLVYGGRAPSAGANWTWWVVWSRPNWRQGTNLDGQPGTILSVGSIPILQVDNKGGSGRLVLFPGGANVVLSAALTRRHTHSIILRSAVDGGVDVWLDGHLVIKGVQNSLPASSNDPLRLLHDGSPFGAAQCWFHEAATWGRALSDAEIGTLATYAGRWPTGERRGIILVVNGQSNAVNYALNDGAAQLLAQGVAWHLGAVAYNVVATTGSPTSYTMQSGHGLYPAAGGSYPGSFLAPTAAEPSTWIFGSDGQAFQRAVQDLSQEDRTDICAFVWPWNETDSLRDYGEKSTFSAATSRFLGLARDLVGKPAGGLPLIWWNAIPYGTASGMQMHREVSAFLAAQPAMNVMIGNPQTADSNPRGSAWDPSTGLSSGGDAAHRDGDDNRRFARLAAPVAARAILASGYGDTIATIPSGVPVTGGPRIVQVYRRDNVSLVLTVAHDAGTDIRVPLQAGTGIGFSVMDGGSNASPGAMVPAISCERMDALHLLVTLARPLRNPSAACGLYYPYGAMAMGRGNAVTDNCSAIPKPEGWDIGLELGTDWTMDYPLAATSGPLALSDTAT